MFYEGILLICVFIRLIVLKFIFLMNEQLRNRQTDFKTCRSTRRRFFPRIVQYAVVYPIHW